MSTISRVGPAPRPPDAVPDFAPSAASTGRLRVGRPPAGRRLFAARTAARASACRAPRRPRPRPTMPRTMPSAPNAASQHRVANGRRRVEAPPRRRRRSPCRASDSMSPSAARASARRSPTSPVDSTGARSCARLSACSASASAFVLRRVTTASTSARASRSRSASLSSRRLRSTASRSASRASRSSSDARCAASASRSSRSVAFLCLDRRQFAIDARQVRGEQRLAARAPRFRVGDDRRPACRAGARFRAPGCARARRTGACRSARTSRR